MVDNARLMQYMDTELCLRIFGHPCNGAPHQLVGRYSWAGLIGGQARDELSRRLSGLRANKYVARAKRADKLRSPETQQKLGAMIVEEYLKNNPRADIGYNAISKSFVNNAIKRVLCIGELISPAEEKTKAENEIFTKMTKVADEFAKVRTAILCGSVEKPLDALREFEARVKEGTWLS